MPSENKTPNLGLNQWQGNEYAKRVDFVEDNQKIDTAFGNLEDLTTEEKSNLVAAVNEVDNTVKTHLAEFEKLLAGGTEYSATLEAGWTGTLTYRKNDLGQVVLSGNITAGSVEYGVQICTLPSGYRPKNMLAIPVYNGATGRVNTLFQLSTSGIMYLRDTSIIKTGDNIYIHIIFSTI